MGRWKYPLVFVALAGLAGSLFLECFPPCLDRSPCFACISIQTLITVATLFSQTWNVVAASCVLLVITLLVGERWRYALVGAAWVTWLAMHLLNYVSNIAERLVVTFKVFWIALLLLALAERFRRRWRELAILCLTLLLTFDAFSLTSLVPEPVVLPNRWLQEVGFRIYAAHLIQSAPPEMFLSRCKLVDYVEENGTKQQVGECDEGLRSTVWFRLLVIYDPSGQLGWPAIQRTLAWRLAALHLLDGRSFVHDDGAKHLKGNFYSFLDLSPARGDDGKARPD